MDAAIAFWAEKVERDVPWTVHADPGTSKRIAVLCAIEGEPHASTFIANLQRQQDPMKVMEMVAGKLNNLSFLKKMNCLRLWGNVDKEVKAEQAARASAPPLPARTHAPAPSSAPASSQPTAQPAPVQNPVAALLGLLAKAQPQQPQQATPAHQPPNQQQWVQHQQQEQHPPQSPYSATGPQLGAASAPNVAAPNANQGLGGLGNIIKGVAEAIFSPTPVQEELPLFDVHLTTKEILFFKEQGYLKVEQLVPSQLVTRALAAINNQLGKGVPNSEAAKLVRGGLGYWPELAHTSAIMDLLYKSPVLQYAEAIAGKFHRCHMGQIALRFPGSTGCLDPNEHPDLIKLMNMGQTVKKIFGQGHKDADVVDHGHATDFLVPAGWKDHWHIDGVPNGLNSMLFPKGTVMQFTMLVGVLLQDLPKEFAGNFTVFPGSHKVIENYINFHNVPPEDVLLTSSSAKSPLPPIQFERPPQQVTGRAGDVLFCHYQTAHTVSPNASENVRYAIYFRLHHVDRKEGSFRPAAMRDIWLEYDGVRAVA